MKFRITLAVLLMALVVAMFFSQHGSKPAVTAGDIKEQSPAAPAPENKPLQEPVADAYEPHEIVGSLTQKLLLAAEHRTSPGTPEKIRYQKPGTTTVVNATRRILLAAEDFQIRETVTTEGLPSRVIEKVLNPGTAQQKIVCREEMAPDCAIVHLNNFDAGTALLADNGWNIRQKLNTSTVLVDVKEGQRIEDVLVGMRALHVGYAEPNWIVHKLTTPNDPDFSRLWGMHNTGQTGGTADADIDAPEAWDITTGSSSVVVAVIDTGIDYTHPDLAPNMWINPGETGLDSQGRDKRTNGIDDDGDGYIDDVYGVDFVNHDGDPKDDNLHGTHCSGTIGARGNNGQGVSGVCWNVSIMALKFLDSGGSGYTSDALLAVDYARAHGARVLSNSWGGGGYSQALYDAIAQANTSNILFVAAAGNDSIDNDQYPTYPAGYTLPNVVSVLATTNTDTMAYFSSFGATTVDLGAPGLDIYSTFPTYLTNEMQSHGFSTNYGTISGTSMATPHVSGAAALLLSREPTLSAVDLKNRLLASTDRKSALANYCASGGRLNVNNAVRNIVAPVQVAAISAPMESAPTSRMLEIYGSAFATDFISFNVEVGQGTSPSSWTTAGITRVGNGAQAIQDGKLADWNGGSSTSGDWTIRLTLAASSGSKAFLRHVKVDPYLKAGFPTYAYFTAGMYTSGQNSMNVTVADITGDGKLEVMGSPVANGPLGAWDSSGHLLPGWPLNLSGMAHAAAADMDRSGKAKVALNLEASFGSWGLLDGSGKFIPGWPIASSNFGSISPTLADVDGDGKLEILVNQESRDLTIRQLDGTPLPGWPQSTSGAQRALSPIVGDLDGDGFNDVFIASISTYSTTIYGWRYDGTTLPGWPVIVPGYGGYKCGIVLGDIDGDGVMELIFSADSAGTSGPGKIFAFKPDGTIKPGWPFAFPGPASTYQTPPALADLNGDGIPEVIVASENTNAAPKVYVLRGDGTAYPGWPQTVPGTILNGIGTSAPVVGDINGDGLPDILCGFTANGLMAWNANGTPIAGFPFPTDAADGGIPAIADIDGDGRNEVIAVSAAWVRTQSQPLIYAWDFNPPGTTSGRIEWGQMRGSSAHAGIYPGNIHNLRPSAKDSTVVANVSSASVTVPLLAGDDRNAPLTYTLLSAPSVGVLTGTAPNLFYTPPAGYRGVVALTFKANDGVWDSRVATVTIIVDDRPVATASSFTTAEDTQLPLVLQATDANSDSLTYTIVATPRMGYLAGTAAARTFIPNPNAFGTDTFTFKVSDGLLESATVTVTINITPVNDPPYAYDSAFYIPMNSTGQSFVLSGYDVESSPLTWNLVSQPANGMLTGTAPTLTYRPNAGYYGLDSITYKAFDGQLESALTTVTIHVNAPPQAGNVSVQTNEDTPINIQLTGTDLNNDTLYYTIQNPAHGTVVGTGSQALYTPALNYFGNDTFTYTVSDGYASSASATVSVQVISQNDPPIARTDVMVTTPGQAVTFTNILANDTDAENEVLTLVSVTAPSNGTLSNLTATGFTYTPNPGFRSTDVFTYIVRDASGASSTGNVVVVMLDASSAWPMTGNGPEHTNYVNVSLSNDALVQSWSSQVSTGSLRQVSIGDGLVHTLSTSRSNWPFNVDAVALECSTGTEVWRKSFGECYGVSPASTVDGRVFVQSYNSSTGQMYALNSQSGATLWTKPWSNQFSSYLSPTAVGPRVYTGGMYYGGMYGFDVQNGTVNFTVSLDQYDSWSPSMYQGRLFTWVNSILREHTSSTGAILWSTTFTHTFNGYSMNTVPAFAQNRAFAIDPNTTNVGPLKLHAIDLTSHAEVWSASGSFQGSPAYLNNTVYVVNNDKVEAYAASNGQVLRTYQASAQLRQPLVTDTSLFVASAANTFVFDLSTGTLRETLPFGGRLSLAGTRLYIATDSGLLQTYTFQKPNTPPSIASVWATPNPVTLPDTVALTSAASDAENDPLTYTWSKLAGPGPVVFTPDTSSTGASTASFTAPGIYTLQLSVTDGHSSTTTSVVVQVLPAPSVLTSVALTPSSTNVASGATQQFVATGLDQYGTQIPGITFSWSATGGTINSSGLYTAGSLGGAYTVTASVQNVSATANVSVTLPSGLLAEFFDWPTSLAALPSLAGQRADVVRIDSEINYPSANSAWNGLPPQFDDTFVSRHTGFIKIDTAGAYTLYVNSDDGSKVYLDGALLIDNDGLHAMVENSATVTLGVGYHDIRVEFFEAGGGAGLILSWSAPGIGKQTVPPSALYHAVRNPASMTVTPANASVMVNTSQQFIASILDQNGVPIQGSAIQWSVNGGGSIDSNGFFSATTEGTYTVSAVSGSVGATATVNVPLAYVPGLLAEFFDWPTTPSNIPSLVGKVADVVRTDAQVNYPSSDSAWDGLPAQFADTFVSRHTGFLKIDTAGTYTLFVNSDDGSKLYLDDTLIINNDDAHGMREYSATLVLSAGYHRLRIEFFEAGGGAGLILSWSGPGIAKQIVPSAALYHAVQIPGSMTVSPANANVMAGATLQFSAAVRDQNGVPLVGGAIQWSVNGGGSINSNGLFTAATQGAYVVSAVSGSVTASANVNVTAASYLAGLNAEFFDYTTALSTIPDLTGQTPTLTRVDAQVNYDSVSSAWAGLPSQFDDTFASRHTGLLRIDTAGSYTLYVNSDDGSKVYLDGALLIDNDGLHGMVEKGATVTLGAGYHDLRIEFFENTGGAGLIFSWSGPGISKQAVPASALWRR